MSTNEDLRSRGPNINAPSIMETISKLNRFRDLPSLAIPAGDDGILADPRSCFPDTRYHWQQLLIVGNGFDLECGLPSDFYSFLTPRRRIIDDTHAVWRQTDELTLGQTLRNEGITFWDVALYGQPEGNWADVEGAISLWVNPPERNGRSHIEQLELALRSHDLNVINNSDVARYIVDNEKDSDVWNEPELYSFLLQELHNLEEAFAQYLTISTKERAGYFDSALGLIVNLLKDANPEEDFIFDESVLSFNYTQPVRHLSNADNQEIAMVNIHGQLGGEIIFGIDGKDCMDDFLVLPFTKTYRLMNLGNPATANLFQGASPGTLRDATDVIKFYGHSLGEADYSYFQAIFDTVRLYESNTQLVFYYKQNKDDVSDAEADKNAREGMILKVTKLLNIYGETMENKDHGKNLIHKLLLEGRLVIKEYSPTFSIKPVAR